MHHIPDRYDWLCLLEQITHTGFVLGVLCFFWTQMFSVTF